MCINFGFSKKKAELQVLCTHQCMLRDLALEIRRSSSFRIATIQKESYYIILTCPSIHEPSVLLWYVHSTLPNIIHDKFTYYPVYWTF